MKTLLWIAGIVVLLTVGIVVHAQTEGEFRLVNGDNDYSGRVEVFFRGLWGTICRHDFDIHAAHMVCRSLGYRGAWDLHYSSLYGSGIGIIWFNDINCPQYATSLEHCSFRAEESNCFSGHSADVGVTCIAPNDGDFRVVNGTHFSNGRVEVFHNGSWGTVCDDDFDQYAADTVCRQLGYREANSFHCCAYNGQGNGEIWLDGFSCPNGTNTFTNCTGWTWGVHDCNHTDDVAVSCTVPADGEFRLVGGYDASRGQVEVFHNGSWGSVCRGNFDIYAAFMVCRSLGLRGAEDLGFHHYTSVESDVLIWFHYISCPFDAGGIDDCTVDWEYTRYCSNNYRTTIICIAPSDGVIMVPGGTPIQTAIEGEFRLVNGDDDSSGRVEVFYRGLWGTICYYDFDIHAANMVCRSLGYSGVLHRHIYYYGSGKGMIWFDDINCPHDATSLEHCSFRDEETRCQSHTADVGVTCIVPNDSDFRLVNGTHFSNGRVEVFHNGSWGTVCDDNFDQYAADIVCRQLGYREANAFHCCAYNGQGNGEIWLDGFSCPNGTNTFTDCTGWTWGVHDCNHTDDVAVSCTVPADGEFRLVGGYDASRGQVEVFHNGSWGSVCRGYFDIYAAFMVCRSLGFSGAEDFGSHHFTSVESEILIWFRDISCPFDARGIDDCTVTWEDTRYCSSTYRAIVTCIAPSDGDFRLVNGTHFFNGRVEVFHSGIWGTVCDDNFDQYAADIVCRQLGYREANSFHCCAYNGQGNDEIWLDGFSCPNGTNTFTDCTGWTWGVHDCNHTEDVAVSCTVPADGEFRLVGDYDASRGQVEVFHNGSWGSVCHFSFDIYAAFMVCRSLGFSGAEDVGFHHYNSVESEVPIWFRYIDCPYDARGIDDCNVDWEDTRYCSSSYRATIICIAPSDGDFRLVNGTDFFTGRVEVFHNGIWGTVCDDNFDQYAAEFVCRQLGYREANSFHCCAYNGQGNGEIWLDGFSCPNGANTFTDCTSWTWGVHDCNHTEDVAVSCTVPADGEFRLVGGYDASRGQVEVFHNGSWGSVCRGNFNIYAAFMVCRSLGFSGAEDFGVHHYTSVESEIPIWFRHINCPYPARGIDDCTVDWEDTRYCSSNFRAIVTCIVPSDGDFRLVNGTHFSNGRVEVFHNGIWGTVCDDNFDQYAADIVCRQLGYGKVNAFHCCAYNGQGNGEIWLDGFSCPNGTNTFTNCTGWTWGVHDCNHTDDVAVSCTVPADGEFRLVGGYDASRGQVEVFHDGSWGSVCRGNFDIYAAFMVCRSLGFSGAEDYGHHRHDSVENQVPIWFRDINCPYDARGIDDCTVDWEDPRYCSNNDRANVICFAIRDGENPTTTNGDSSTVAAESSTSLNAAATEPEVSVTTESDGLTTPSNLPEYPTSATGDSSSVPAESSTSLQVASTEAEEPVTTEADGLTTPSNLPDPCHSNPCGGEGTCDTTDEGFTCSCAQGYHGDTCEMRVNRYVISINTASEPQRVRIEERETIEKRRTRRPVKVRSIEWEKLPPAN